MAYLSWMQTQTWIWACSILVLILTLIWRYQRQRVVKSKYNFPDITSLPDFSWETTEPMILRPFKPKYHLTMGLSDIPPSTLLPMDKTYKHRLSLRASLLTQQYDTVLGVHSNFDTRVREAVSELYAFVLGWYLPRRYPRMFTITTNEDKETGNGEVNMLENKVTGDIWPVELSVQRPVEKGLEVLGRVVDEDFLILLPDTTTDKAQIQESEDKEKYILSAYIACYPSGFNPRQKLGRRLASIHAPVPGYEQKLERSMDRFFSRLEIGRFVHRVNWSVTVGSELFAAFGGTHAKEGEEMSGIGLGELDVDKTVFRCERQTLHRLPGSKALVFAFHTYTYPIQMIKDEGLGEELATAIDGLKEGNVPGMHYYKRGPVWGEAVKAFLRN